VGCRPIGCGFVFAATSRSKWSLGLSRKPRTSLGLSASFCTKRCRPKSASLVLVTTQTLATANVIRLLLSSFGERKNFLIKTIPHRYVEFIIKFISFTVCFLQWWEWVFCGKTNYGLCAHLSFRPWLKGREMESCESKKGKGVEGKGVKKAKKTEGWWKKEHCNRVFTRSRKRRAYLELAHAGLLEPRPLAQV